MNIMPFYKFWRGEPKGAMLLMRRSRKTLVLMSVLMLMSIQAVGLAANSLKEISYASLPGDVVQIILSAEGNVELPGSFTTDNPARIALDFVGMTNGLSDKTKAVGVGMVRSVTAVEAGNRTRVVVNLVEATPHDISVDVNQVTLLIKGGSSDSGGSDAVAIQRSSSDSRIVTPAATNSLVRSIDFRRGDSGEGQVVVELNDSTAVVDMREEGGRIVLDILNTSLPEELMRKFDVSDFATPVKEFEVSAQGDSVHVYQSEEHHLLFG